MYEIIYKIGTGSKAHTYQRVRVQFVAMPLGKVSTYPRIRRGSIYPMEADEYGFRYFLGTLAGFKRKKTNWMHEQNEELTREQDEFTYWMFGRKRKKIFFWLFSILTSLETMCIPLNLH